MPVLTSSPTHLSGLAERTHFCLVQSHPDLHPQAKNMAIMQHLLKLVAVQMELQIIAVSVHGLF